MTEEGTVPAGRCIIFVSPIIHYVIEFPRPSQYDRSIFFVYSFRL